VLLISQGETVEVTFKRLWCTFIILTPPEISHIMGFKARMFGETLILSVLLIVDTRNIVSGKLLPSDNEWSLSMCRYVLWQLQVL
jgi:hypothetical protein